MAKQTKEEVDYRHGTKGAHCSICTMFMPPNKCTAVEGKIFGAMWCKLFKRRKHPLYDHPRSNKE